VGATTMNLKVLVGLHDPLIVKGDAVSPPLPRNIEALANGLNLEIMTLEEALKKIKPEAESSKGEVDIEPRYIIFRFQHPRWGLIGYPFLRYTPLEEEKKS